MTNESLHIYTRSISADSTHLWGEKITAKKQFPAIVRKIIRKQTRMKGERSLEFNKIHKCLKRKTFKGWLDESYLCHFTPDLSPPKATTRKANERSCFLRCSIKSLICSTPKRGFYSLEKIDGLSAVEGVAGWWLRRGPFISLRDRRQTAMAAATLLAPVAMNIGDTKIN